MASDLNSLTGFPALKTFGRSKSFSGVRKPALIQDLSFYGPESLRGGGHGHGHGGHGVTHHDLSHHYDEDTLRLKESATQREKIVNTIRIVTGLGTIGTIAFCCSL